MNKDSKRFAIGALIAGAAGYVAGILTAPKSGKETRKDVKDTAIKVKHEAEKDLKKLHSEVAKQIERAKSVSLKLHDDHKEDLNKLVSKAVAAKDKARNTLTSIHEGGIEDKDLQAVVKDINTAVTDLKKYLDNKA